MMMNEVVDLSDNFSLHGFWIGSLLDDFFGPLIKLTENAVFHCVSLLPLKIIRYSR